MFKIISDIALEGFLIQLHTRHNKNMKNVHFQDGGVASLLPSPAFLKTAICYLFFVPSRAKSKKG